MLFGPEWQSQRLLIRAEAYRLSAVADQLHAAEFLAAAAAAASAANTSEPEPESFGKTRVTEQLNSKNQRLKCELRDCAVCVHEKQVTLYLSLSLCLHVCLTVRLIATYSCM